MAHAQKRGKLEGIDDDRKDEHQQRWSDQGELQRCQTLLAGKDS
jgi:hypothetical protein